MKRRGAKITTEKVQKAFNRAIVRRDKICRVRESGTVCAGDMQCSHFFPVGGNGGLRFYPANAYAQCAGHHFSHHNRNPAFYHEWMMENAPEELEWMESVRGKPLRYSQGVLAEILECCENDDLESVALIVRGLYGG